MGCGNTTAARQVRKALRAIVFFYLYFLVSYIQCRVSPFIRHFPSSTLSLHRPEHRYHHRSSHYSPLTSCRPKNRFSSNLLPCQPNIPLPILKDINRRRIFGLLSMIRSTLVGILLMSTRVVKKS